MANGKTSQYTETTTLGSGDLFDVSADLGGGAYGSRKITWANILSEIYLDEDFVQGPATSTDNAVARFDLATGQLIQNSGVLIDDSNNVTGVVDFTASGTVSLGGTTLSAFALTLLDDADQATAQGTLGVDPAGTDNSTDVTLAGTLDYLTIVGQVITLGSIDLTTDVTGVLPAANGGTGLTSISTLLNSNVTPTTLGLVIGTNVQAWDADLDALALDPLTATTAASTYQPLDSDLTAIAALNPTANNLIYKNGGDTWDTTTITTFGRSLVDDANASTARTTLGLVIGTDVQAWDANLDQLAALTPASSLIIGNGLGGYEMVTPANFITNNNILDTADIGVLVQAYSATLAAVAGGTYTGATSITTLGTIATGVWQGTAIANAYVAGLDQDVLTTSSPTFAGLTVASGSSGATASTFANEIVVEGSGSTGVSILSTDLSQSRLYFGSASNNLGAFIVWDYANTEYRIGTNQAGGSVILRSGAGIDNLTLSGASGSELATFAKDVVATGTGTFAGITATGTLTSGAHTITSAGNPNLSIVETTGGSATQIKMSNSVNGTEGVMYFDTNEVWRVYIDGADRLSVSATGVSTTGTLTSGAHTVNGQFIVNDSGSGNPLARLDADDQAIWGLIIGNSTYSSTDTNGLRMQVKNAGTAEINNTGGDISITSNTSITGTLGVSGDVDITDGRLTIGDGSASSDHTFDFDLGTNSTGYITWGLGSGGTGDAQISYGTGSLTLSMGSRIAGGSTVLRSGNFVTALTLDSSQNATFAGTLTSGAHTVNGTLTLLGQYLFTERANGIITIANTTSGQATDIELGTADADGTDSVKFTAYSLGKTPTSLSGNREGVSFGWNPSYGGFEINSDIAGTGTPRSFRIALDNVTGYEMDTSLNSTFAGDVTVNGTNLNITSANPALNFTDTSSGGDAFSLFANSGNFYVYNVTDAAIHVTYDGSLGTTFAGAINLGAFDIQRTIDTDAVTISGGSDSAVGANWTMFGSTHVTLANDARLRASATTVYYYDHSETSHTFTGTLGVSGDVTLSSGDLEVTSGNVAIGTTGVSTWNTAWGAVEFDGSAIMGSNSDERIYMVSNGLIGLAGWEYKKSSIESSRYYQDSGTHIWSTAASGTAGNTITWSEKMRLTNGGNLLLGGTAEATSAVGAFHIFNGTAPSAGAANAVALYSKDLSAGNTILGIYTEGSPVGTGTPTQDRTVAVEVNGTTLYLLAATAAS